MLVRKEFQCLKFCDILNMLFMTYDSYEIISNLISHETIEIEKKCFLFFLIYKQNFNFFNNDKIFCYPKKIEKLKSKFNNMFYTSENKEFLENFEEKIILTLIKSLQTKLKLLIKKITSLNFGIQMDNSNKVTMSDLFETLLNQLYTYIFLLILKFKFKIILTEKNYNKIENTLADDINILIKNELFNELKNQNEIIGKFFSNILKVFDSLKKNECATNNIYETICQIFKISQAAYEDFLDIYIRPDCYEDQYEKNLNFFFADNEEFTLYKAIILLSLNLNSDNFKIDVVSIINNYNSNELKKSFYLQAIFEESIIKDFSTLIKNSSIFKKYQNISESLNDTQVEHENHSKSRLIEFSRHKVLSNKIQEVFKIENNPKVTIFGPISCGKTAFIKKFTQNELLIDVDETIEVNVGSY